MIIVNLKFHSTVFQKCLPKRQFLISACPDLASYLYQILYSGALAACHYIPQCRETIFSVLYKALNSSNSELQEAAHDCMKKFIAGCHIEMEQVHTAMRPLLLKLGDFRSLSLNVIQRLSSLTQLFPNTFNEKLCEQLLVRLFIFMHV